LLVFFLQPTVAKKGGFGQSGDSPRAFRTVKFMRLLNSYEPLLEKAGVVMIVRRFWNRKLTNHGMDPKAKGGCALPIVKTDRSVNAVGRAIMETLEERALLSAFTVTNTADSGTGSLRAAVLSANAAHGTDTITIASNVTGTINLSTALPILKANITITGPGATKLTVNGGNHGSVFIVGVFTSEIEGLSITGGYSNLGGGIANYGGNLTVANCVITNSTTTPGGHGGGIFNGRGSLNIVNSTISGNSAASGYGITYYTSNVRYYGEGGGVFNGGGKVTISGTTISGNSANRGGGIYNNGGAMTLTSSTVTGNTSQQSMLNSAGGGGIYDSGGLLTLDSSTIKGNTASGYTGYSPVGGVAQGGGLFQNGGMLTITSSTFQQNVAHANLAQGGGIQLVQAKTTITSSTITGNQAVHGQSTVANYGGGLNQIGGSTTISRSTFSSNYCTHNGGALAVVSGTVSATSTLFSGNIAIGSGAAIYTLGAISNTVKLINCTFSNNSTPGSGGAVANNGMALTVSNSILWGDKAAKTAEILQVKGTAAVSYSDVAGGYTGTANKNITPGFVSATNFALASTSKCVNVGSNPVVQNSGTLLDLAGKPRIVNSIVDMGAYELQTAPAAATSALASSTAGSSTSPPEISADILALASANSQKLIALLADGQLFRD
jgi:predicted outer membrane repeat protein